MENKKQLIIVPPMSQALQKLNEVLEGIAADENIEISMIDDLKELGQVLPNTGQCLILCSNPKKCATFLQENRFIISRFHIKTMLFTPKEIPAKTLIKFTKVGLTESILENSPPKTLLYKIKLQLRSIKSTSQEDKEKEVVKNLQDTGGEKSLAEEDKTRERVTHSDQEEVIETEQKKKFENEENVIDYGGSLKGKVKPQEEAIDTHWKSKRKNTETTINLENGKTTDDENSESNEIDLYYRGKSNKENVVFEESEDYRKLKRLEKEAAEEAERKRTAYRDEINEESIRQKKIGEESSYESDSNALELKSSTDMSIDLDDSDNSEDKKEMEYEPDEKKNKKHDSEIELENTSDKNKAKMLEDLGGHYKGKISTVNLEIESEQETEEEKKEYDNTDLDEKKKRVELELAEGKKKKSLDQEEEMAPFNSHDGEVDHLVDEMMDGELSTDHIDTFMGSGKKSTQEKNEPAEQDDLGFADQNTEDYENDESDLDNSNSKLDLSPADKKEKEKRLEYEENKDLELLNENSNLDLIDGENQVKNRSKDEEAQKEKQQNESKLVDPTLDLEKDKEEIKQLETRDITLKKKSHSQLDLEQGDEKKTNNSVEKIDTYYRSHDSKNTEHDWDLKHDKKSNELAIIKSQKADINIAANAKAKDNGEITIDYRKLKEEFDQIARGESIGDTGAFSRNGQGKGIDAEDEGSFKVIEVNPRGLDFSIALLNVINQKNVKPKQIFAMIAEDIFKKYNGTTVFWDFKLSDKKHNEVYNSYLELALPQITSERKEWWLEYKKDTSLFSHFQTRSMTNWRCPQIIEKNSPWEDVELPTWAKNELGDKLVELAFPYFDGVDRMGLALVIFHEGVKPEDEHAILTTLEMARHLLLETIQRYQVKETRNVEKLEIEETEKESSNKVLSFFGGLFGKRKAG